MVRINRDPGRVVRVAAEPARGAAKGEHHHEQDRLLGRRQQAEDDVLQGGSVQHGDMQQEVGPDQDNLQAAIQN